MPAQHSTAQHSTAQLLLLARGAGWPRRQRPPRTLVRPRRCEVLRERHLPPLVHGVRRRAVPAPACVLHVVERERLRVHAPRGHKDDARVRRRCSERRRQARRERGRAQAVGGEAGLVALRRGGALRQLRGAARVVWRGVVWWFCGARPGQGRCGRQWQGAPVRAHAAAAPAPAQPAGRGARHNAPARPRC
jgi:hypothetical protein